MDVVRQVITETLPRYLEKLPVPSTTDELLALSQDQLIALLPLFTTVLVLVVTVILALKPKKTKKTTSRINTKIDLTNPKVATIVPSSEIKGKVVYCRCWKSEKFPYCDGSHAKWNQATGDNIGPLVISE